MELTKDELTIIKSRIPFFDMEPGEERLKAISNLMQKAQQLYYEGPESMISSITVSDGNGKKFECYYDPGDMSVGIFGGWGTDAVVKDV